MVVSLTSSTRSYGKRSSKVYTCHRLSHLPPLLCALSKFLFSAFRLFFLVLGFFFCLMFVWLMSIVESESTIGFVCLFVYFLYFLYLFDFCIVVFNSRSILFFFIWVFFPRCVSTVWRHTGNKPKKKIWKHEEKTPKQLLTICLPWSSSSLDLRTSTWRERKTRFYFSCAFEPLAAIASTRLGV